MTPIGNQHDGILVMPVVQYNYDGAYQTTIGLEGVTTIISGNEHNGIEIENEFTHIKGRTLVGLAKDGKTAVPNKGVAGIFFHSIAEWGRVYAGVVVSGNAKNGIYISAAHTDIYEPRVGTSEDGAKAVPNENGHGIYISDAARSAVYIGGGVVSGNGKSGIFTNCPATRVVRTLVGLSVDGKKALPNQHYGIEIGELAVGTTIGAHAQSSTTTVTVAGNVLGTHLRFPLCRSDVKIILQIHQQL